MVKIERGSTIGLLVLSIVAVAACLIVLRDILIPMVMAMFLAILFKPIIDLCRKIHIPTFIGLFVVLGIAASAVWGVSAIVGIGVDEAVQRAPVYAEKSQRIITNAQSMVTQIPGGTEVLERVAEEINPQMGIRLASDWLGSAASVVGDGVMMLLYLVFIILGSDKFGAKLDAAMKAAGTSQLGEIYEAVNQNVLRYLRTKTLFNLLNAGTVYGVLTWYGVDFAPVIAMLAFFFSYLPNIGSFITVFVSGIVTLVQFENLGSALLIVLILIVLGNLIGNVLEPKAMGQSLNLSPVVVLFALVFWGWAWGIVGMVLSVPITAICKVIMEQFPLTQPVAILMSNAAPAPNKAPSPQVNTP
ncbi:MAG: AI-2E family transporter [Bradyrhizobiaceae bacterium]|nr:AI-2E family transporter [Bradyrhizobiaceae bacterium]